MSIYNEPGRSVSEYDWTRSPCWRLSQPAKAIPHSRPLLASMISLFKWRKVSSFPAKSKEVRLRLTYRRIA